MEAGIDAQGFGQDFDRFGVLAPAVQFLGLGQAFARLEFQIIHEFFSAGLHRPALGVLVNGAKGGNGPRVMAALQHLRGLLQVLLHPVGADDDGEGPLKVFVEVPGLLVAHDGVQDFEIRTG